MSIPTKNHLFRLFCIACAFLITRLDADTLGHLSRDVDAYDTVKLWNGDASFEDEDEDEDEDFLNKLDEEEEDADEMEIAMDDDIDDVHAPGYDDSPGMALLSNLVDDAAAFDAYVASVSAAYGLDDEDDDLGPSDLPEAAHASLRDDHQAYVALHNDEHPLSSGLSQEPSDLDDWSMYLPEELMVFGEAGEEPMAPAEEDPFAAQDVNAPAKPVVENVPQEGGEGAWPDANTGGGDAAMADDPFATETANFQEGDLDAIFQKEAGPSLTKGDQDTISIDFADTTIRAVLRNVADIFGLNLAIPDGVVGNVSLKLQNVTWRQVFDLVLEPIGYVRVEDGNIVKIKSRDDVLTEPVDTAVFIVDYASAEELKEPLSALVDENLGGGVQLDKRANALIVTERPSRLSRIAAIIKQLDRPEPQVMIESKFVETQNSDALSLGFNYSDKLIAKATDPQRSATREHEYVSDEASRNIYQNPDTKKVTQFRDTAIFSLPSFEATLNMLKTDGKTKIINNPTVVTLNNKRALITVGKRIPIPNYTYNEERGTYEVTGFQYLDTGTILGVEPHVNTAGFITLAIKPEVSEKGSDVPFSTNAMIPEIDSVRTESVVTIKDGFTVAIGGLMRDTDKRENRRVPILGQIPVLGNLLFRSRNNSRSMRNILIFITARTLNPDGSSYEEVVDPRVMHEMDIKPYDLPGYEVPAETRQRLKAIEEQEVSMAHERTLRALDREKISLNRDHQAYLNSVQKMDELERKRNQRRHQAQRESVSL